MVPCGKNNNTKDNATSEEEHKQDRKEWSLIVERECGVSRRRMDVKEMNESSLIPVNLDVATLGLGCRNLCD